MFVRVTAITGDGSYPALVNLDHVAQIYPSKTSVGCVLVTHNPTSNGFDFIMVTNTMQELTQLLQSLPEEKKTPVENRSLLLFR